jgi:hypothetical protein
MRHYRADGRSSSDRRRSFTLSALLRRHGLDDRVGAAEAFGRDRDAGIDGGVQQNLRDLFGGDAIVERAAHMHFEFVPARQRRQHADIEHAARLVGETVAQPGVAPALGGGFWRLPAPVRKWNLAEPLGTSCCKILFGSG